MEEAEGVAKLAREGVKGDERVPDDIVSAWARNFVEEEAGGGEGDTFAVEVEEGGGDERAGEEAGGGSAGVDGAAEGGEVEKGDGLEAEGEDEGVGLEGWEYAGGHHRFEYAHGVSGATLAYMSGQAPRLRHYFLHCLCRV